MSTPQQRIFNRLDALDNKTSELEQRLNEFALLRTELDIIDFRLKTLFTRLEALETKAKP